MSNKNTHKYEDKYNACGHSTANPECLINCLSPLVAYGLKEGNYTGIEHAMMKVILIAYVMGMGFDRLTARKLVESWEEDGRFPGRDKRNRRRY